MLEVTDLVLQACGINVITGYPVGMAWRVLLHG